jgi:CheY-like chemotaxis protein
MSRFEEFELCLSEGLTHLYDPTYEPPPLIWQVTGCQPQQGVEAVQAVLIQAIEALKPTSEIPKTARIRRFYQLLFCRYIQELTQVETALHLDITPRHVRREQQEAIHVLARYLWGQKFAEVPTTDDSLNQSLAETGVAPQSVTWRSQVQQELASLQQNTPGAVADVGATMDGILKLGRALTSKHGIELEINLAQPNLMAVIHPSALRQVLITAIEKLVQHMSGGEIRLWAKREATQIKITVTGQPANPHDLPHSNLIQEIVTMQGGSVEIHTADNRIVFELGLLSADKDVTVLVVDDNADLVNFYRNYTTGTRYQIIHLAEGTRLFETIADAPPDIIVLDVMLPNVDGWELLTYLYEHPDTRVIPVIICSVVKREELAEALGAALYLPKPVRRQQFIQALDQVLGQVQAKALKNEANNAITD